MYQTGQLIFYGATGVCEIVEIKKQTFIGADSDRLYYVLKPVNQDCTISIPVDSDKVFMRPIITKAEAERLIGMIPSIQAVAYHTTALRELTEHYDAILKSHDCESLLELTMSIYAKKQIAEEQRKKFGAVDETFMKRAENLLFGELAAALEIPRETVQDYIAERVKAATDKKAADNVG